MALGARIKAALLAFQGVSAYQTEPRDGAPELGSPIIERVREALGGQLQPISFTKTRWFLADLETATHSSDSGDMALIGQLWRSMKRDGYVLGLTETRTAGLVALPIRWRGSKEQIDLLTSEATGSQSYFQSLVPPAELGAFLGDLLVCGVAVGELLPVKGRDYPVFCRLDPEFLIFRWNEQRWYYRSVEGLIPINPGDGRWVLAFAGARLAPWQSGLWPALGRAYIVKDHATLYRANYSGKLANPARLAYAPNAATEDQRVGFLSRLLGWGPNTTIELPPGWEAKLLESNGRGWEVFKEEIDNSNQEIMIALAGQFVTVTGGTGFANADIHETIRADLIKRTADAAAFVVNTQILPQWAVSQFGEGALEDPARLEWDTKPPEDQIALAKAMTEGAKGLEAVQTILSKLGIRLNVEELVSRFGWPTEDGEPEPPAAAPLAPPPGFGGDDSEESPIEKKKRPPGAATKAEKKAKKSDDDE